MNYNLKDKIKVTEEFLNDFITKSWHETEALQQQIANIDTSSELGSEVVGLLKNMCTSYYILIGGLEDLIDVKFSTNNNTASEPEVDPDAQDRGLTSTEAAAPCELRKDITQKDVIEPFEYFVDFDEPLGNPITDRDLYG